MSFNIRNIPGCCLLVLSINLLSREVVAYDPDCTHRTLTRRTAELYSLYFGKSFTQAQIKQLEAGSVHEDTGKVPFLRATNHFYDIYNQRPWTAPIVSFLTPCLREAQEKDFFHTSKAWALTADYQQQSWITNFNGASFLCFYDGDYSWPTILKTLDRGATLDEVMFAEGHILHLLQDLTVPAHTRNDTHLPFPGDAYEQYAKNICKASLIFSAAELYTNGVQPILLSTLGDYFDSLALYSYIHYFSDDTKYSPKYNGPVGVRREKIITGKVHTLVYGQDQSSAVYSLDVEYQLLEVNTWLEKFISPEIAQTTDLVYVICDSCLNDYWQRLSRKAMAYGVGALRKLVLEKEIRDKKCDSKDMCVPNEKKCNGSEVYVCAASGCGFTSSQTCTCGCADGRCTAPICNPGMKRCSGSTVETCGNFGCEWSKIEDCATGCMDGQCKPALTCVDICRRDSKNCGVYLGCNCGVCTDPLVCDNASNVCRTDTTARSKVYRYHNHCGADRWSSNNNACYPGSMGPTQGCPPCANRSNLGCMLADASCWFREDPHTFDSAVSNPGFGSFSKLHHCFEGGANSYSRVGCATYGDPPDLGWIANTPAGAFNKPLTLCYEFTGTVWQQFLSREPGVECTRPGISILMPNPFGYVP